MGILDCDTGGNKCRGGSMAQAFEWVKENGLCAESDDAYKCADQSSSECTASTCSASSGSCSKVIQAGDVTGCTQVSQSEGALEAAVAQQPVSVAIEADQQVFQHYTGGVLTSSACGSNLDHGVLAVGYGSDNGQKHWLGRKWIYPPRERCFLHRRRVRHQDGRSFPDGQSGRCRVDCVDGQGCTSFRVFVVKNFTLTTLRPAPGGP